jgi:hypothetical protein
MTCLTDYLDVCMKLQSIVSLTLLAALSLAAFGVGWSQPAVVAQPSAAPPKSKVDQSTFLIQPGRVGRITNTTTREDLSRSFGAANLQDFTAHGAEGQGNFPATRVLNKGQDAIVVLWADAKRQQAKSVRIYDARWHTPEGFAVGTPVSQMQKVFGKFQFFGFGWDFSGQLIANNADLDRYRQKLKVDFRIGLPPGSCKKVSPDCQAVLGEKELSSADQAVRRLKARIVMMSVVL